MLDICPVPNWTVYRTKEPCECGGKYTARAFLDDRVRSSCDKRPTMPDEYISRAEALEITTRTCGDYAAAFAEIRKLPAADVAEVVRCKDCIFRIKGRCFSRTSFLNAPAVDPDNFCSWGVTE